MNRSELIELVRKGRTVVINLQDAEVVSCRSEYKALNHWNSALLHKIVVKDPVYGAIFFSSFSQKIRDFEKGDKVSLKVTVTGVGDANGRYPDPILFARAATRKADSVAITKPIVVESDLSVNV